MQKDKPNPFSVLAVTSSASAAEVKKAYRRLVAAWHPDRFTRDSVAQRQAQERLKEINAAYADCLKLIAQRRVGEKGMAEAVPPAKKAPPVSPVKPNRPEAPAPPTLQPPLVQWPNLLLAAVLAAGWMVGLRRYGMGAAFLQFVGLLAIVPGIAAFWYNARLLRGRLMLGLYVTTVAGAGLFLVLNQALYEQQALVAAPTWQGGSDTGRGFGSGGVGSGEFTLAPSATTEQGFGPTPPQVLVPTAPLAPMAPLAPSAPLAPRTR